MSVEKHTPIKDSIVGFIITRDDRWWEIFINIVGTIMVFVIFGLPLLIVYLEGAAI